MMTLSIYRLKPGFQLLLRPLVETLSNREVSPNEVTVAATLLSLGYGGALWLFRFPPELLWAMPLVLLVRMALNALDGQLARQTAQSSRRGALLNEICDVVADLGVYGPFAFATGLTSVGVVSLLFLATLSEFVGVAAQAAGGARRFEGPFGKSDRAVFFGLLALILPHPLWANRLIVVGIILGIMTLINRTKGAWSPENA